MARRVFKKDIARQITDVLGVPPARFSTGSSEPKNLFAMIVDVLRLRIDSDHRKEGLAAAICSLAGVPWGPECDSRNTASGGGGTVTTTGLLRVLEATRILAVQRQRPRRAGAPWTIDEFIVVGDLYLRRGRTVGTGDAEVITVANDLGRSPDSISYRVGNFAGTEDPSRGLKPITGEALAVWQALREDPRALADAVAHARSRIGALTNAPQQASLPSVEVGEPEEPGLEPFEVVSEAESRVAQPVEARLVRQFRTWLDPTGQRLRGIRIRTSAGAALSIDLYDPHTNLLIEAKARTERNYVRMAIGQLLDYRRYLDFDPSLGVLLPSQPSEDLMGLIRAGSATAIWPHGASFVDADGGLSPISP